MKPLRYMQVEQDFEMTHEGREYLVFYTYSAELGRSWITAIADLETEEIIPKPFADCPAALAAAATIAKEHEETSQAERAAESVVFDGWSFADDLRDAQKLRDELRR